MPDRFDVVILGGGSGGYVAAIRAGQLGLRTAVVENDKVGGTCLHRGCIPTKALLQSAALLDQLKHAATLGVNVSGYDFDYPVAARRRDQVVDTLHKGVQGLLRKNRATVVKGRGRLAGAGRVSVAAEGGESVELEAGHVIVATGSRPRLVPGLAGDGARVVTSDDALFLDSIPESAIVLGAGAVGVEFASFWASAGSAVTLVEMAPRLVPLEDEAVGAELGKQFAARGITCLTGTTLDTASVEQNEGGVAVTVHDGDGRETRLQASLLLVAIGRSANVEDIGLEDAGVSTVHGNIEVDGELRSSAAGVSAIGDCVGGFQLAHKAMHEGVIAVEAIAGRHPHALDSRLVTRTTYCAPQIASLGLAEHEAKAAGYDVATGTFPFRGNARAVVWGETGGFCKVVADNATNTVLGVHIIGNEVTELIQGPALGALLEATPFEMSRAVAPHPTLSEAIGEAALAVSGQALHI